MNKGTKASSSTVCEANGELKYAGSPIISDETQSVRIRSILSKPGVARLDIGYRWAGTAVAGHGCGVETCNDQLQGRLSLTAI